ncbi:MAG: hypothetical protein ACFNL3_05905, partial [Rothia aeria]
RASVVSSDGSDILVPGSVDRTSAADPVAHAQVPRTAGRDIWYHDLVDDQPDTHEYELAKFGREGITASGAGLTPLVVAGLCYLIITVPLGQLSAYFEKRTGASRK